MAKRIRFINPKAHRPVNWSETAVAAALATDGYLIVQTKEDGIRFHAFLEQKLSGTRVVITTREGIEILSLEQQKEQLRGILQELPKGFVIDGEVVVQGVTFEAGSGMLRAYEPLGLVALFFMFDAMPLVALLGTAEYPVPYSDRLFDVNKAGQLAQAAGTLNLQVVKPIRSLIITELSQAHEYFDEARKRGYEGAVVKRGTLLPRNGKVVGQWKLKPSDTEDGIIRGLLWGTPGLANEGKVIGFTVELENGALVDVTGITQAQMIDFTAAHVDQADTAFTGRYIEVAYMERTANGSLRHPSFVKFRDLDYSPGIKS
jgi:ATP-dependent DNA ligase